VGLEGVGPGGNFIAAAVACLIAAAISFSVAGCCQAGNLPGVGVSHTSCCCTERDPATLPVGAIKPAAIAQSPQVIVIGQAPGIQMVPMQGMPMQGMPVQGTMMPSPQPSNDAVSTASYSK